MTAQLHAITHALSLTVQAGLPVLIWGSPGTGKSSAVRSLASALGLPCEVVIASIREPSDFAGLPVVLDGSVSFAPPRWAQRLAEAGRGILFLDEISTAPPAVQAALLRVVLDRVVGDLELPAGVAVVAAANPPEEAADGWDLSAPLANRFVHLDWPVDHRQAQIAALLSTAISSRNDSPSSRDMNHTERQRLAPDEPHPPERPTPDMGISKEDPQ